MKKEITSRMNRIIQLITLNEVNTLKDISDVMAISLRQVRYDITRLNEAMNTGQAIPVIETDNKGVIVINDEECLSAFNALQEKKFKCSKEQRLTLLVNIIAFNIKELNLNKLSKQLNVTRVTIKNDLNEIKENLDKYHLTLIYINHFHIVGNEEDIFEFRLEALRNIEYTLYKENFEKIEYLLQEYNQNSFTNIKLRNIMPIVSSFLKKNNLEVKDFDFYWLSSTILLMLWYCYKGFNIPSERHLNVAILNLDYSELFTELSDFMRVDLNDNVESKIKAVISSIGNNDSYDFNRKVIGFIFNLIILFPNDYRNMFIRDQTLLKGLYDHVERCCKKMDASLDLAILNDYNVALDDKLEKIIDTYCMDNKFIVFNKQSDCDLVKLHFANCLCKHPVEKTKKVILVSGASTNAKNHLKAVLESLMKLKVIAVLSKYELPFYQQWDKIDIVLFTEAIPEYFNKNIPVAKINLILNDDDFLTLSKINIIPKEHCLDLNELYLKLEFLNQNEQLQVIKLVYEYLRKHIGGIYDFDNVINYDVKIVNDIDLYNNCIVINDNVIMMYQVSKDNSIEIMIDRSIGNAIFKVLCSDYVSLLYLLFYCYQTVKQVNIFTLTNEEIIRIFKNSN